MKNFDSRTYSINDFLEWEKNKQLELSPRFQRRAVWTNSAKSYLMDTIVRGKPMPKVFIRQKINTTTKSSTREVVDGQQRLRTILDYLKDGFAIQPKHNAQYGGLFFSQLDEDAKTTVLNYEISVDLLVNMPDSEVLDVFARLNSYAVLLNTQEKIHSDHFGPFKNLVENLAHLYNEFWLKNKILSEKNIMRMDDSELVANLLIASFEGIKDKKQTKNMYDQYEKEFSYDIEQTKERFSLILEDISRIFQDSLPNSEFRRSHLFYSLFTALYHIRWGLPGIEKINSFSEEWNYTRIRSLLEPVEAAFSAEDRRSLAPDQSQFLDDSRNATTDLKVRQRRTQYLLSLILKDYNPA